jgi:hypothetical protein
MTPAERLERRAKLLAGAARRNPGPPAPAQVFVCLACDFKAKGWETVQRHARAEHPVARIEQRDA